jgi:hypothetical protein
MVTSRIESFYAPALLRVPAICMLGLFSCFMMMACPPGETGGSSDGDAGGNVDNSISCESVSDCPDDVNWDCLGICLYRCAGDAACAADEYCTSLGYCQEGCRDSSTCAENQVCIQGACTVADEASSCGSKCDCALGQACVDAICQDPLAVCNNSDDCGRGPDESCEAIICNGITNQCVYPNAPACTTVEDCAYRPGCETGCICTPSGNCVPSGDCTDETVVDDCGAGFFCNDDLACETLPPCTSDTDCADLGLSCNEQTGACEQPVTCATDADCTVSPTTFCDTTTSLCVIPTCLNGGVVCAEGSVCSETGICVIEGTGDSCSTNSQCTGYQSSCPNACEFCSLEPGATQGNCATGCSTNSNCASGTICNQAHECVSDGSGGNGGLGQNGDPCADIGASSDCQVGLTCTLNGICQEICGTADAPCDPSTDAACCAESGLSQCEPGLFFSFCQ